MELRILDIDRRNRRRISSVSRILILISVSGVSRLTLRRVRVSAWSGLLRLSHTLGGVRLRRGSRRLGCRSGRRLRSCWSRLSRRSGRRLLGGLRLCLVAVELLYHLVGQRLSKINGHNRHELTVHNAVN